MENKVLKAEQNAPLSEKEKGAKILSIIVFCVVMTALAVALITDAVIFSKVIILFVVACLGAIVVFIIGIMLMVISLILIFGFYIIESQGFWPLTWSKNAFISVLSDAKLSQGQLTAFLAIRSILLIICIFVFIASIVALALIKSAKKDSKDKKVRVPKGFAVASLVLSILGFFAALVMMILVGAVS